MAWWNFGRKSSASREPFCAIIHTSNNTLVALGTNVPAYLFVSETMLDTTCVIDVNLTEETRLLLSADPRTLPAWSWSSQNRDFKPTHPGIVTEDMRERAAFAAKKIAAIVEILYW